MMSYELATEALNKIKQIADLDYVATDDFDDLRESLVLLKEYIYELESVATAKYRELQKAVEQEIINKRRAEHK